MSERLNLAMEQVKELPVITLGHIVDRIEGEAILILCLISILPFMQPIPIPGLSSVLGLIVFLQGIGLLVWGKPLLTKRLKAIVIPRDKFEKIYNASKKFSNFTSKISTFKSPIAGSRPSHILCGISIIISSAFLSLPLPIPFSNLIPALSIFMICLGLLEEDIVLLLIGHGITITVFFMAVYSFAFMTEKFKLWF